MSIRINWMLKRKETYRGDGIRPSERKLKNMERNALKGLQKLMDATLAPDGSSKFS